MRLPNIQAYLKSRDVAFTYCEDNDCGSIQCYHRGLSYHMWESPAPERGAASNLRTAGRDEDFEGDYERTLLEILRSWE